MKIRPLNDIEIISEISSLSKNEKYLVGGCVRDWLLNKQSFDLDFLFSIYPLKLIEKFSKNHNLRYTKFERFLTIRLFMANRRLDFAAFRKESYPSVASLPLVSKADSLEEDLKRRDFSVNSIAISLNKGNEFEVIDPYKGVADIKAGLIRILHNKSFRDDPTRLFRAARFSSRFGWKLEKNTERALFSALKNKYPSYLSRERVRNELFKILEENKSYEVLNFLNRYGLLDYIYEGLEISKDIDKFNNLELKLSFIALKSKNPEGLINSLNLEKSLKKKIFSLLRPFIDKRTPVNNTDEKYLELIKVLYPKADIYRFTNLFIDYSDLKKAGINNIYWNEIINKISHLQWLGRIKNKKEALKFIK
jgi:tRNA nucleotidyltransferase/poly(A) polymerase